MNKKFYFILSLFALSIMAGAVFAEPKLTVPETEFDFGYVPQHAMVSHTYWLHSTGTETLKIVNVKPGCGCTKAPLQKSELAVGDSTDLEVIFSTKTFRGRQSKRTSITTNAELDPQQIKFTADVVVNPDEMYPIKISPYKFDISQFGEKERTNLEFNITNVSEDDLKIELIDIDTKMFKIKLPDNIKAGQSEKGTIEISDQYVDGEFEKSLTIELNDNDKSRFTIPIKRTVRVLGLEEGND